MNTVGCSFWQEQPFPQAPQADNGVVLLHDVVNWNVQRSLGEIPGDWNGGSSVLMRTSLRVALLDSNRCLAWVHCVCGCGARSKVPLCTRAAADKDWARS
jgi:hypothetical protein